MRFLYLSMSAGHARSSPARQALTRRSSLQLTSGPRGVETERLGWPSSWGGTGPPLLPEQFLDVPEREVAENRRPEVAPPPFWADEHTGTDETRDRQVLRHQLLHPIVETFPSPRVERGLL